MAFKCAMTPDGWAVSADAKLKQSLAGLGRNASDDLQTVVYAVNGITKHQVLSLSEIAHEKKARELAAVNRAQLQNAIARDDKAAIDALSMTQERLERRAAMHKAAARAHAVASEQSMLVAQNLEAATGRSSRGMNGLGDIGSDEDVRRRKEAALALHTQLNTSANLTFDGKSIAGKGWVDAFRNAVRKGYDVPMPKEQMSAPRVGIGTDTDVFPAKENYVGATLQGVGGLWDDITSIAGGSSDWFISNATIPNDIRNKWADHCQRTYGSDPDALRKCKRNPGTPTWAPWTQAGKAERGLEGWFEQAKRAITGAKTPPKLPAYQQAWNATSQWATNFDYRTQQATGMSASTLAIGALVLGAVGFYAYRQSQKA